MKIGSIHTEWKPGDQAPTTSIHKPTLIRVQQVQSRHMAPFGVVHLDCDGAPLQIYCTPEQAAAFEAAFQPQEAPERVAAE